MLTGRKYRNSILASKLVQRNPNFCERECFEITRIGIEKISDVSTEFSIDIDVD